MWQLFPALLLFLHLILHVGSIYIICYYWLATLLIIYQIVSMDASLEWLEDENKLSKPSICFWPILLYLPQLACLFPVSRMSVPLYPMLIVCMCVCHSSFFFYNASDNRRLKVYKVDFSCLELDRRKWEDLARAKMNVGLSAELASGHPVSQSVFVFTVALF